MALERDRFPPGVPCWVDVTLPDPPAAASFYARIFGWELEDVMPAGAPGHYFIARLGGREVAAVGSQIEGAPPAPSWNTYIGVEDAEASAARVREAGGRVLVDPFDVMAAGRMAVCADPAGAVFNLWEPGTRKGAELVNAPGSWNWSNLNTPDPDGATAFYGAVCGWEAASVTVGALTATMWRLPGYADFLEQFDPDMRRRHAEPGIPEGFSDAIGWLFPLGASERPSWSVAFSVDDIDGVAARAKALGGRVLVAPNDLTGGVRLAVLADPQGGTFSVTRY